MISTVCISFTKSLSAIISSLALRRVCSCWKRTATESGYVLNVTTMMTSLLPSYDRFMATTNPMKIASRQGSVTVTRVVHSNLSRHTPSLFEFANIVPTDLDCDRCNKRAFFFLSRVFWHSEFRSCEKISIGNRYMVTSRVHSRFDAPNELLKTKWFFQQKFNSSVACNIFIFLS